MEALVAAFAILALSVAFYFGFELSKTYKELEQAQRDLVLKDHAIRVMKKVVERSGLIHKEMDRISKIDSLDELLKEYNATVGPK